MIYTVKVMLRVQGILMYANALLVQVDKEMFTVFYVYTICSNKFYEMKGMGGYTIFHYFPTILCQTMDDQVM